MAELKYGAKLMASWMHLAAIAGMGLVLVNEIPASIAVQEAARVAAGLPLVAGGRGAAWAGLRMVEVFLPALAPVIAAPVIAAEQSGGGAELAASRPGSLRQVVVGRFVVIAATLAAVLAAAVAWVTGAVGSADGGAAGVAAWALVKAAWPTMWALACATVLGSVLGGVFGGFGAGLGWWALDLMTGGSVTRRASLFLFGAAYCST